MFKGTGKPLPLKDILLMLYHAGQKLKKPPDTVKDLHDSQLETWERVKADRARK